MKYITFLIKLLSFAKKTTYQTEDNTKPAIYTRRVKGGGLDILQVIIFDTVLTLSTNTSAINGKMEHNNFTTKPRHQTNL